MAEEKFPAFLVLLKEDLTVVVPPRLERGTWGSKPRELPLLQGTQRWFWRRDSNPQWLLSQLQIKSLVPSAFRPRQNEVGRCERTRTFNSPGKGRMRYHCATHPLGRLLRVELRYPRSQRGGLTVVLQPPSENSC